LMRRRRWAICLMRRRRRLWVGLAEKADGGFGLELLDEKVRERWKKRKSLPRRRRDGGRDGRYGRLSEETEDFPRRRERRKTFRGDGSLSEETKVMQQQQQHRASPSIHSNVRSVVDQSCSPIGLSSRSGSPLLLSAQSFEVCDSNPFFGLEKMI